MSKVYHPIFRNGEHADKFRTEFPNVKINIPPISIEKDEITVAGEKEAVLKVTEYIKKSVKDMVSSHSVSYGILNSSKWYSAAKILLFLLLKMMKQNQTFVLLTTDVSTLPTLIDT